MSTHCNVDRSWKLHAARVRSRLLGLKKSSQSYPMPRGHPLEGPSQFMPDLNEPLSDDAPLDSRKRVGRELDFDPMLADVGCGHPRASGRFHQGVLIANLLCRLP